MAKKVKCKKVKGYGYVCDIGKRQVRLPDTEMVLLSGYSCERAKGKAQVVCFEE